jgi:acyl carrier protein
MSIAERVQSIIVESCGFEEEEVTPSKTFIDDLGLDSLDAVEVIVSLEDEYGIEIDDDEVEKLKTVQDLIDCVVRKAGT